MREQDARMLQALRKWSVLLDSAFRVPGTRVTFGLDPILGLIPGLGDLATPFFSGVLLLQAVRLRIPRIVLLRMLMNTAVDMVTGVIPLVGDLVDVGWKANVRNLALLEQHARPGTKASADDWAFVAVVLLLLVVVALIPLLFLAWVLSRFPAF
jgi:hypothetical protein